jgi:hypothetical protein
MKIPALPFTVTNWSELAATTHAGETGEALWRSLDIGDLRVRMVEYSPGYLAITGATGATCSTSWKANSIPNCATGAPSSCCRA